MLVVDPTLAEAFASRKPGAVGFKATVQSGSIVLVADYHGSSTSEDNFAKLTAGAGGSFLSCSDCLFLLNTRTNSERGKWTLIVYLGSKDSGSHLLFADSRSILMQALGMDNFSTHCYCARSPEELQYECFNSSRMAARSPVLTLLEENEREARQSRSALFEFPPNVGTLPFKVSPKLEESVTAIVREEGGTNWLEIEITDEEEMELVVAKTVVVREEEFCQGQINNDEPRLYIYKHLWGQADGSSTLFLFYTCPEPAAAPLRARYSASVPGMKKYLSQAVTEENMEVKAVELSDPRETSHGTSSLGFADGVADALSKEDQFRNSTRSSLALRHSVQLQHRPPMPTASSTDQDGGKANGGSTQRRRPSKKPAVDTTVIAALDAAAQAPAAAALPSFILPWAS
jgi:hypothetical protein